MKRLEFKQKIREEFPEVMTIGHEYGKLRVRTGSMSVYSIPEATKTTWTEKNLQAILEYLRNRKKPSYNRIMDVYYHYYDKEHKEHTGSAKLFLFDDKEKAAAMKYVESLVDSLSENSTKESDGIEISFLFI